MWERPSSPWPASPRRWMRRAPSADACPCCAKTPRRPASWPPRRPASPPWRAPRPRAFPARRACSPARSSRRATRCPTWPGSRCGPSSRLLRPWRACPSSGRPSPPRARPAPSRRRPCVRPPRPPSACRPSSSASRAPCGPLRRARRNSAGSPTSCSPAPSRRPRRKGRWRGTWPVCPGLSGARACPCS